MGSLLALLCKDEAVIGHVLWDVEGLSESGEGVLFVWLDNRNDFSLERIEAFLQFADLPPLQNPDFPPRWVLLHFIQLCIHHIPGIQKKNICSLSRRFIATKGILLTCEAVEGNGTVKAAARNEIPLRLK
ncbi:MAG: hypothetical protein H6964_12030 [Chromatiaceae bacterium]|nr:hypothetical protein [Chromatiaceae bacterium]MCP5447707.1 hypothetical protein [Chromatiaceae bacterium]